VKSAAIVKSQIINFAQFRRVLGLEFFEVELFVLYTKLRKKCSVGELSQQ